ncbi:hypothetical protein THAOC_14196, partial [Thalassiosira oceanica]
PPQGPPLRRAGPPPPPLRTDAHPVPGPRHRLAGRPGRAPRRGHVRTEGADRLGRRVEGAGSRPVGPGGPRPVDPVPQAGIEEGTVERGRGRIGPADHLRAQHRGGRAGDRRRVDEDVERPGRLRAVGRPGAAAPRPDGEADTGPVGELPQPSHRPHALHVRRRPPAVVRTRRAREEVGRDQHQGLREPEVREPHQEQMVQRGVQEVRGEGVRPDGVPRPPGVREEGGRGRLRARGRCVPPPPPSFPSAGF